MNVQMYTILNSTYPNLSQAMVLPYTVDKTSALTHIVCDKMLRLVFLCVISITELLAENVRCGNLQPGKPSDVNCMDVILPDAIDDHLYLFLNPR